MNLLTGPLSRGLCEISFSVAFHQSIDRQSLGQLRHLLLLTEFYLMSVEIVRKCHEYVQTNPHLARVTLKQTEISVNPNIECIARGMCTMSSLVFLSSPRLLMRARNKPYGCGRLASLSDIQPLALSGFHLFKSFCERVK